MPRLIFALFTVATFVFSGCAYNGVVVAKRFRPLPFPDSLGIDGIYNFQLRDSAGQIYSQMVNADVFASYRVGDYFNDLQSPPSREGKEMQGFRPTPQEMNEGPYQPVRVMQTFPPTKKTTRVAAVTVRHRKKNSATIAKSHHRTKHSTKIAKHRHHTKKTATVAKKHRARHHTRIASND